MSTTLPVTFRASPLPTNFGGTPQEFLDALVERLSIESQDELSFFVTGSVAPTSDVGPWLKDGTTWYVWDVITGAYIPLVLAIESLRYIASQTAPDQNKYIFWIVLDVTGKAQSIKYYSGGAWKDIYEDKFLEYSTTTQMNAAILFAVTANRNRYPSSASLSGTQAVPVDTDAHKIEFDVADINPSDTYDVALFRYKALVDGYYEAAAFFQVDNDTATAASLEFALNITKNGGAAVIGKGLQIPSPSGARWWPDCSGMVFLAVNDYLEVYLTMNDTVNTGSVNVSSGAFTVKLIQVT